MHTIDIWIHNKALGLRCAKTMYSADFVNDVLKGHHYHGKNGVLVVRLTKGLINEDDHCDQ